MEKKIPQDFEILTLPEAKISDPENRLRFFANRQGTKVHCLLKSGDLFTGILQNHFTNETGEYFTINDREYDLEVVTSVY